MHVVQVDGLDPEPLEALLQRLLAVLRRGVNVDALGRPHEPELGRELADVSLSADHLLVARGPVTHEDVLAAFGMHLEPLSDEVLVVAIDVCRIPVDAAYLPSPVQDLEAVFIGSAAESVVCVCVCVQDREPTR